LKNPELEKSKALVILEILEYIPNSIVIKTIMGRTTGNVSAISFDTGKTMTEKISPFDKLIQVIDGQAEILIGGKSHLIETGQSIIMPAHSHNVIKANVRFKMISTVIKSGYEE
jgi:quercetin dioxygenase-like cupin family protein